MATRAELAAQSAARLERAATLARQDPGRSEQSIYKEVGGRKQNIQAAIRAARGVEKKAGAEKNVRKDYRQRAQALARQRQIILTRLIVGGEITKKSGETVA